MRLIDTNINRKSDITKEKRHASKHIKTYFRQLEMHKEMLHCERIPVTLIKLFDMTAAT